MIKRILVALALTVSVGGAIAACSPASTPVPSVSAPSVAPSVEAPSEAAPSEAAPSAS
jgi:hypothetical protein